MTCQQRRVIKGYSDVSRCCLSERVRDFSLSTVCCANYKTSKKDIATWVAIPFLNACMLFIRSLSPVVQLSFAVCNDAAFI